MDSLPLPPRNSTLRGKCPGSSPESLCWATWTPALARHPPACFLPSVLCWGWSWGSAAYDRSRAHGQSHPCSDNTPNILALCDLDLRGFGSLNPLVIHMELPIN